MSSRYTTRQQRRLRLQQRQTVIFGVLIAAMAFAALFAWLVAIDAVPAPFQRAFTPTEKKETSTEVACPASDAVTVDLSSISAAVYNSTDRQGLASEVSETLTSGGVTVTDSGNWQELLLGAGQLQTGPAGIDDAYTLLQLFPGMTVMLDDREDAVVDVVLGYDYTSMGDPATLVAGTAVTVPEECLAEESTGGAESTDESTTDQPSEG